MRLPVPTPYRFDDFELDPSRRVLLRAGEKLPLAPKAVEVLQFLVRNANRVVLKGELLKAVWPDSFVEESNLAQHIFSLRKALGDKAGFIVTIPGRGYEFTGQLLTAEPTTPVSTLTLQHTTETTHTLIQQWDSLPVPRSPRRAVALTSAILLLAVLGTWGWWRWMSRAVPGDHHEVVLADFENSTGNSDFDRALRTLLAIDLSQSPYLVVAGDSDTRKILKQMNRPPDADVTPVIAREVCERLNDQVVLAGLIARFGQKYLVTLTATDCAEGSNLVQAKSVADDREGVIAAVDRVADDMRRRLGEPLKTLRSSGQKLQAAHTFSLDALRAYSQGHDLHARNRYKEAIAFYTRATELDPRFAVAYSALGFCYNNIGEALAGRNAMEKAYQLRDQAEGPDRLNITTMYEYWNTGDRHQAIRTYQAWAETYPRASYPWLMIGQFQTSIGQVKPAIQAFQRAIELNPNSLPPRASLAEAQFSDGQLDAAKATTRTVIARGLDSTDQRQILRDIAILQHDQPALQEQMDWYLHHASEDDNESSLGELDLSRGKIRSAVAHYQRAAELRNHDGAKEAALEGFSVIPRYEAALGLIADARRHLQRYDPIPPLVEHCLTDIAISAADAGDLATAEIYRQYAQKHGEHSSDIQEQFLPMIDAAVFLTQRKPGQALASIQFAAAVEETFVQVPILHGRAFLAAAQPRQAEREFRIALAHPFDEVTGVAIPLAHLGLARALELQGNHPAARQEYEALFTLWKDADPDLPVLQQARREYAHLP